MKLLEEDLHTRSVVIYEKKAALLCTYSPDFNLVEEAFSIKAPWHKHNPEPAKASSKR